MEPEIRNTKERTKADGSVEALQFKIVPGKRPVPMGWKQIKPPGSATPPPPSGAPTPKPRKAQSAGRVTEPRSKRKQLAFLDDGGSPTLELVLWGLGAAATGAVILGCIYVIANRGS